MVGLAGEKGPDSPGDTKNECSGTGPRLAAEVGIGAQRDGGEHLDVAEVQVAEDEGPDEMLGLPHTGFNEQARPWVDDLLDSSRPIPSWSGSPPCMHAFGHRKRHLSLVPPLRVTHDQYGDHIVILAVIYYPQVTGERALDPLLPESP